MMSPHLQAIRATVSHLVDHIEAAISQAPASGKPRLAAWLERHPLVFAVGSLGIELAGARLLARTRRRPAPVVREPRVTWWMPADRSAAIH